MREGTPLRAELKTEIILSSSVFQGGFLPLDKSSVGGLDNKYSNKYWLLSKLVYGLNILEVFNFSGK